MKTIAIQLAIVSAFVPIFAHAGSAIWDLNPGSGDWNTATNWTPATVPNGSADTATFDVSNTTVVTLSASAEVNGIVFNAGASAFTIATFSANSPLLIDGLGITNNSGIVQNFFVSPEDNSPIFFTNNATAGNQTSFTVNGMGGNAVGAIYFAANSTASNSTIANNGGVTIFQDSSTADAATLIANGGINGGSGGAISFMDNSTGGTSRVEVFGNGKLDISSHNAPGVTIGSIEGSGNVFLGANNLTVGANNLSTIFSGAIQDGRLAGGTGGSLIKLGSGTLSLTNSNTYSGGTLINAGTLQALHDGALGVGSVSLTAASVTLTLQGGATNNYIADAAGLSIVSNSTVDLNFSGTPDTIGSLSVNGVLQSPGLYGSAASGAPNQLPEFTGTGEVLVVPEPGTSALISLGALALILFRPTRFSGRDRLGTPAHSGKRAQIPAALLCESVMHFTLANALRSWRP
jgi:autotransporter-associated beta strand protein